VTSSHRLHERHPARSTAAGSRRGACPATLTAVPAMAPVRR